jgi:hypothetical protein
MQAKRDKGKQKHIDTASYADFSFISDIGLIVKSEDKLPV